MERGEEESAYVCDPGSELRLTPKAKTTNAMKKQKEKNEKQPGVRADFIEQLFLPVDMRCV